MHSIIRSGTPVVPTSYHSAAGPIDYTFLNDYMFHIVFQNIPTLTGLICSLLKLQPEQIRSIIVTNPIEPGQSILGKTFVLDIHVILNDYFLINLELQVINEGNWPERSLSYLCRTFDNLYKGENYKNANAAIHIGILDFTLFPDHPKFYTVNKLMNEKTHYIYSDKFQLHVLDLTQINRATEADKAYRLDQWAALFKATTWEEIKMLAEKNPYIDDAAQRFYEACVDFSERENLRAKREYEIRERRALENEAKIDELQSEINALQDENAVLRARLSQYELQYKH